MTTEEWINNFPLSSVFITGRYTLGSMTALQMKIVVTCQRYGAMKDLTLNKHCLLNKLVLCGTVLTQKKKLNLVTVSNIE